MSHKDYVAEHVELIRVLREGDEEELKEMANEQLAELKGQLSTKEFESLDLDDEEEDE